MFTLSAWRDRILLLVALCMTLIAPFPATAQVQQLRDAQGHPYGINLGYDSVTGLSCIPGLAAPTCVGGNGSVASLSAITHLAPSPICMDLGTICGLSVSGDSSLWTSLVDPVSHAPVSFLDLADAGWALNSATSNATHPTLLNGSLATASIHLAGLTASGATVTFKSMVDGADGSPVWSAQNTLEGSSTTSADGDYKFRVAGKAGIEVVVTTTGAGTISGTTLVSAAPESPAPGISAGKLVPIPVSHLSPFLNMTTATTTRMITGTPTLRTLISHVEWWADGALATNWKLIYGSRTTTDCDTGATDLSFTYRLNATAGWAANSGDGTGAIWIVPAGKDVCAVQTAAANLGVGLAASQAP